MIPRKQVPHSDSSSLATRRGFLQSSGLGAAASVLGLQQSLAVAAKLDGGGLLAPRPSHDPPKAKQLVILFFTGGFSQVDTFDYKPLLQKNHEKLVPAYDTLDLSTKADWWRFDAKLLKSPFKFARAGESGLWISDLFPHLSTVMDELCVIRTLHTDIQQHSEATLAMHTGSPQFTLPGIGAWLSYGLGTFNRNLPAHIVLSRWNPYGGTKSWDNGFLPPQHQGVRIIPGDNPISDIESPARSVTLHQLEQRMLRDVNSEHAELRPHDFELAARTDSFATANGMMRVAPPLFDLSDESESTLKLYGVGQGDKTSFGYQCLVTRRLVEQGVRVIEVIDSGSGDNNWDAHGDIFEHRNNAKYVDQGTSALISDLRQRGLLDDTLIAICTEFGRTPWYQHPPKSPGRNHWERAFTCLLVGAGVKGGLAYGETNEWGSEVADKPCHVHDYHATILHLLGIDHTKLTYRYGGRDFRLTDVYGDVVTDILS